MVNALTKGMLYAIHKVWEVKHSRRWTHVVCLTADTLIALEDHPDVLTPRTYCGILDLSVQMDRLDQELSPR